MTDSVWRVGALAWLLGHLRREYETARTEVAERMRRGDKLAARSPLDDRRIATVSMSDPATEVTVTDLRALTEWMVEHYPDHVEEVTTVVGPPDEVAAVLAAYAPHLVRSEPRICDWALAEVRTVSESAGEPVGPGGETGVPGVEVGPRPATLTVRSAGSADEVMAALVRARQLGLDGRVLEVNQ